ncbi:uncharacterized protein LOC124303857 [Neodiprion virginianus]|uniref:uncharacterized protein LOC124303857 n=1 Tax=Neodiprion virginianus TaxID=2961670 RepID=UPI001EE7182C|nr:uncharacterized protein LOC124303857 [Neodiprion virginianus]XP_046617574.1 uncharacterized protein LOC124303857 [Neodiprion virginianus]XP_046617575.1 uncharacterized protein LOC124303857 [Neodiprion virginianus]XP_046617576.1 uncharacterized protein LOC124303857 [Neodiprion virginianus]XP_046617577.1 uncharacterized protein LOC124303857 [Neodiprion virginianus]XP_046617578.1 uncharacterized protein LOC124303857 [Neodiprion virginianus]
MSARAMEREPRNGTTGSTESEANLTSIYFFVGDRCEVASFDPDRVTHKEIKELFRSAAEAGPLDIVKLRQGEKLLNISPHLPSNTPETPYSLQVVGAHPGSTGMLDADLLRALERRVSALERELREHQEIAVSAPLLPLRELKRQVDAFRKKLETTEHLSWLGFYKQLPEPISTEACRRLQYRRKSDTVKRTVREKFLNICDVSVSSSVRQWLRSPAFDARQWEDEELLLMLQAMFVELDLLQKFSIPLATLRNFLYEVYNNYNEVPFHNFRHCFCVAQMMYAIAWAANLPSKIGDLEVFVLLVSCICHDLDHPGYNNIYQINARTELALRYNDISPLENHHCSVAFRVLESPECNILASLDTATFRTVREGIIRCILATDMARHNEILGQFRDITPEFDYTNKMHTNLLTMVLIKVADISNEARPMDVAEPWLDRLLQEFFKQSDAEKLEGLPVTPFMDRDKVTKPSSQCSFIGLVLLPLFEALGELLPELQEFIVRPVRDALEYYRRLNEAAKDERMHRKSIVDLGESNTTSLSTYVVKSSSAQSVRSKRSGCTLRSRSRSIEDSSENLTIEEVETGESSDPETATEVEVSEKTLKFKISTEGSTAGRKSYPGSRKGSRDRSTLDYHHHDLAKAMREHDRDLERYEVHRGRGDNLSSDMSSPVSARSLDDSRIVEELERDETEIQEGRGNGNENGTVLLDVTATPESCSCSEERDKSTPNNHKSLLSRLRTFTDRLSISFDSRESPSVKQTGKSAGKGLSKSNSVTGTSPARNIGAFCKRCNLTKVDKVLEETREPQETKETKETRKGLEASEVAGEDKRAMTLPKARKNQEGRNKGWKTVFAKDKRPSVSLEAIPATDADVALAKHKRNFSNPEGKLATVKTSPKEEEWSKEFNTEFKGIDGAVRTKPEIVLNPSTSTNLLDKDIGKVEIRRSSASMEDITKITMQNESIFLGSQKSKDAEELQHTGSLDSMLHKETDKACKKTLAFSSPGTSKKYSAGIFSRFKSGMSIDSARSNSGPLNDQQQQQPQQQQLQGGWISSLAASFRPKRQGSEAQFSPQRSHYPNHDGFK